MKKESLSKRKEYNLYFEIKIHCFQLLPLNKWLSCLGFRIPLRTLCLTH